MEFTGNLEAFPPASILQWVEQERRSGTLVVRRRGAKKRVVFRAGHVVGCASDGAVETYGRYLLLYGHVTGEQLVGALRRCRDSGKKLGAVLVEAGVLGEGRVRETLKSFFLDTLCDLFLWQRGVFYFEPGGDRDLGVPPEAVDPMRVVMEGTRWIDELGRIRQLLVHDNVVLRHGPERGAGDLTPFESRIGSEVDGRSTLREVYQRVAGSHFRFLEAAYDLCLREVLDIASIGEPETAGAPEPELSELLLEKAAADRPAIYDHHLVVPLELLARVCPRWLAPPPAAEVERLAPEIAGLVPHLDGETVLRTLLADDPAVRRRQVAAVLGWFRRSRLLLLPVPAGRLEARVEAAEEALLEGQGGWLGRLLRGR